MSGTITFIGDSLLDDFYWLQDKSRDLTKEVSALGFTVNNYAVDGSRLNDVINGISPSDVYIKARSYPYQTDSQGKVHPLKLLHLNDETPLSDYTKYNMVVLSIGGNDLKGDVMKILFGLDSFFKGIVTPQYQKTFDTLLHDLKQKYPKVVLASMYLPYLGPGSIYGPFGYIASAVVKKWKEFILPLAKKHNIAVLDLSQTFDSNNKTHYGVVDIQPSNISNKSIAKCLHYIYNNYQGYGIYFAPNCDISQITVTH